MKNLILSVILLATGLLSLRGTKKEEHRPDGCILLRFDGYMSVNDDWSTEYGGSIYWKPSRLDKDEKESYISKLKQYFDLWDVQIVTDTAVYNKYAVNKRVSAVITSSVLDTALNNWEIGVSMVGNVFRNDSSPSLVSVSMTGYNMDLLAVVTAHELGHALGLKHKISFNKDSTQYYPYDPGDSVQGPIMGAVRVDRGKKAIWTVGPVMIPWFGPMQQDDIEIISYTWKRKK